MTYITFNYMYRDYSNYKNHNTLVFSNPNELSLEQIESAIREHLIDGEWFHHNAWQVPDRHFEKTDWELDHSMHCFNYVELITNPVKVEGTIDEFLKRISKASNEYRNK